MGQGDGAVYSVTSLSNTILKRGGQPNRSLKLHIIHYKLTVFVMTVLESVLGVELKALKSGYGFFLGFVASPFAVSFHFSPYVLALYS
jgi:hypothetical protein